MEWIPKIIFILKIFKSRGHIFIGEYNFLTPILKEGLIRLGNKMDGGYVVDDLTITEIDTFLSFGLGDGSNTDNTPWSFENDLLKKNPNVQTVRRLKYLEEVFHLYHINVKKKRDNLIKFLKSKSIDAKVHYPIPIHKQKPVLRMNLGKQNLPVTELQSKQILSLPINHNLKKSHLDYVVNSINNFFPK